MVFFNSRLIFERMKEIKGRKSDKDLAISLDVAATTLANWKNRNNLPVEVILTFAHNNNVSLDWLIFGKENKPALDEMEQMLLNNYKRLDPAQKLQLLNASLNGVGSGVNQVANGDNNKQQLITGNVGEVTGIRK